MICAEFLAWPGDGRNFPVGRLRGVRHLLHEDMS